VVIEFCLQWYSGVSFIYLDLFSSLVSIISYVHIWHFKI
jgi:hypothetical protein